MEEVLQQKWRTKKFQIQLGLDTINYAISKAWDGKLERPDWMRQKDFVPCDCKRCYFCLNGFTTGIAHKKRNSEWKWLAVVLVYYRGRRPAWMWPLTLQRGMSIAVNACKRIKVQLERKKKVNFSSEEGITGYRLEQNGVLSARVQQVYLWGMLGRGVQSNNT